MEFENAVKKEIKVQCDKICNNIKDLWFVPSPFMNTMIEGGIYNGAKYNNFGIHGTGVATGADSLVAGAKYDMPEEKYLLKDMKTEEKDYTKYFYDVIIKLMRV